MKTFLIIATLLILASCQDSKPDPDDAKQLEEKGTVKLPFVTLKEYCINGVVYYFGADYSKDGGPVLAHKINQETLLPEKCKEGSL